MSAVQALADARRATTVAALSLAASLAADPSAALDALDAIDPDTADAVAELIAEREDRTPAEVKGEAALLRLDILHAAASRKAVS